MICYCLGITDVDSSVPAELIFFFNSDLSGNLNLVGYPSTTWVDIELGELMVASPDSTVQV